MTSELKRLERIEAYIIDHLDDYGLQCVKQYFDLITDDYMFTLLASRLPANFSHWRFGRDYERYRTQYEHGKISGVLELVFNLDPSRAYILKTLPLALKVLTMTHVYWHNDFFTNNAYFTHTNRKLLSAAMAARERFLGYENKFGIDAVEYILEAAASISYNVDPDLSRRETQDQIRLRLLESLDETDETHARTKAARERLEKEKEDLRKKIQRITPLYEERDILFFVIENSPKLQEMQDTKWRDAIIDMLSVTWEQSRSLLAGGQTKIMNEGWASYGHQNMMDDLLREGYITPEEYSIYAECNGNVLANNPLSLNPYLLGSEIWYDIKDRWDKGKFGKDYEECVNTHKRETWNTNVGRGKEKILEVRKTHNDWRFIDEYMTQEVVDRINYYLYDIVKQNNQLKLRIRSRNVKTIIEKVLEMINNFGLPVMYVEFGNYKSNKELLLKHTYDGRELDPEYREKTMEYLYSLWGRPVHIKTREDKNERKTVDVVYSYDGRKHMRSGKAYKKTK